MKFIVNFGIFFLVFIEQTKQTEKSQILVVAAILDYLLS